MTAGEEDEMQPGTLRVGIGDMLDETFRLVQRNLLLFVGLVAVLEIPLKLLTTLLINAFIASDLAAGEQRMRDATQETQHGAAIDSAALMKALLVVVRDSAYLLALFMLLSLVVTGILGGVFSLAVAERFGGCPAGIARTYATAMHRLAPLAGALLLRSLLLLAVIAAPIWAIVESSGNLAHELPDTDLASASLSAAASHDLAVLGIGVVVLMPLALVEVFLYVRWALCAQAVVLEGRGLDSLSRSWRLVSGAWWKSFGVLLIGFLAVTIAARLVDAAAGPLLNAVHLHGNARTATQWVIDTLVAVVTLPISLALQTLLFFDLKARKEGFDLGRLAEDLDAAST
jgi:heme/copper-type cytochrome/quinol oxidase subunit 2